jgi:hypothetical protein
MFMLLIVYAFGNAQRGYQGKELKFKQAVYPNGVLLKRNMFDFTHLFSTEFPAIFRFLASASKTGCKQ